jgi:3-hydroxybutyryl-CoA dehydrogenase
MKIDQIKNITVLGAGTMGFGIALVFAVAGYRVNMYGRSLSGIARAFRNIRTTLETFLKRGLVQQSEITAILAGINGVTSLEEAVGGAHFVIEAIDEKLAAKQQIFAGVEEFCPDTAILASNTSGLGPTAIAGLLRHKDRFVVAHFWNPPYLMPAVEIVPGQDTSERTVNTTCALMERIGRIPVTLTKEFPGFIGNRLQLAMLREALYIVESGIASVEAVDAMVKYNLGRRLSITGPLESVDLGGLDVFYNISAYLMKELCTSREIPVLLKESYQDGNLGAKTGKGFYGWTADSLAKTVEFRENSLIDCLQRNKRRPDNGD